MAVAAIAALGFEQTANADTSWNDASPTGLTGTCGGTSAYIGYEYEANLFPMTGDSGFIHIFVKTAGCYDSPIVELRLPPGSVQDTSRPVQCGRGDIGSSVVTTLPAQGPDHECFQTPQFNSGAATYRYGWSKLKPNQWFEIMVPVKYYRRVSGGTLSGLVGSALGPINVAMPIDVGYKPTFESFVVVNSYDSTQATMSFYLGHYNEAGTVDVDYGSTPSFGSTISMTASAMYTYYSNFTMPTITGLASNTTYYWRARITVPGLGTFYGPTQQFTTYAQFVNPSPPVCWRYPCVRR